MFWGATALDNEQSGKLIHKRKAVVLFIIRVLKSIFIYLLFSIKLKMRYLKYEEHKTLKKNVFHCLNFYFVLFYIFCCCCSSLSAELIISNFRLNVHAICPGCLKKESSVLLPEKISWSFLLLYRVLRLTKVRVCLWLRFFICHLALTMIYLS